MLGFAIIGGFLVVIAGIVSTAFSLSLPILVAGQYLILSVILLAIGGFMISRGMKHPISQRNKNIVIGAAIGIGAVVVYLAFMSTLYYSNSIFEMSNQGMAPAIRERDIALVDKTPIGELRNGDIVVFYDQDKRVIVSRVQAIVSDDPRVLQTEGDAKPSPTRRVSEGEYIGKVYHVIPQLGNYIFPLHIAVMIGIFLLPVAVMTFGTRE